MQHTFLSSLEKFSTYSGVTTASVCVCVRTAAIQPEHVQIAPHSTPGNDMVEETQLTESRLTLERCTEK